MALLGDYRNKLDAALEEEPGEVGIWENVLRLETAYGADPVALERWGGAEADELLRETGLSADAYSRSRLIGEMHRARLDWAEYQLRRAGGDNTPDPRDHWMKRLGTRPDFAKQALPFLVDSRGSKTVVEAFARGLPHASRHRRFFQQFIQFSCSRSSIATWDEPTRNAVIDQRIHTRNSISNHW